ncbi:MAG: nuclear transport factor 2 family protein [Myxococcota bacterium]
MATDRKTAIEVVDRLYALRSEGDIEGLVALMTDDFRLETHAPTSVMPFAGQRAGRPAVLEYFEALDKDWAFESYDVRERIVDGDRAAVVSDIRFVYRATGKVLAVRKVDLIGLRDGRICSFDEHFDSAAAADCQTP